MSTEQNLTPPAIGEAWVGQGGTYGGIMPARNGSEAYHMIFGDEIGKFKWGPYAKQAPEVHPIDGRVNTQSLVASDGYPAAEAAAAHQADGHTDFYLPAIAELNEVAMNIGICPWGWVWSSTQRSVYLAYTMGFETGTQGLNDKDGEAGVRPFRRVPIQ